MTGLEIPVPPFSSFFVGPVEIHLYAICVLCGILVAGWLGRHRFVHRGGDPEVFDRLAFWLVLAGILGARLYHVITDHQLYFEAAFGSRSWKMATQKQLSSDNGSNNFLVDKYG